eukprot:3389143-Prymnesium_polylepis.1
MQCASHSAPLQLVFRKGQLARIDVAGAEPLELGAGPALCQVAHLAERACSRQIAERHKPRATADGGGDEIAEVDAAVQDEARRIACLVEDP